MLQLAADHLLWKWSNILKFIMVSVGVSVLGCTELKFISPCVKINGAYYRDTLPKQLVLLAILSMSMFQQDNRAKAAIELLTNEMPDFISPLQWPPISPDLNPVDFTV